MNVIVLGAGIGGLSMALMLHARGIPVRIFESTRALRPLGVGINVQPSAVAELALIGLLERMAEVGVKTAEVCSIVTGSRSGESRAAWRPAIWCRSFPSTAARCRCCC